MDNLLFTAPDGAIPKTGTNASKLLNMLKHCEPVQELLLAQVFDSNQRSPIQDLGNDYLFNWLVHPVENGKGKIIARQLDKRHISGNPQLDDDARKERKRQLKEDSYKQAKQGRIRETKAQQERDEARKELFLSLGDAANDPDIESKKPTKD